jgi:hypothetical protein
MALVESFEATNVKVNIASHISLRGIDLGSFGDRTASQLHAFVGIGDKRNSSSANELFIFAVHSIMPSEKEFIV